MTAWDDLASRARGLGAHILDPAALQRMAASPDPGRLASGLRNTPYGPWIPVPRPAPSQLEDALRRRESDALQILARWAGPGRLRLLAPLFEDEDLRSLRVLLRAAVAGLPEEERTRGLLPTPGLPERRLEEASRAGGLGALAGLLGRWEHPLARAVAGPAQEEALRAEPDLFRLEDTLTRAWATRVRDAVSGGPRELRTFVRETLDETNLLTASARVRSPAGASGTLFLDGGVWLGVDAFREAVETDDRDASAGRLRVALTGTPLEGLPPSGALFSLEEVVLTRAVERWRERARQGPVGPGPVVHFWLRLRREVRALRRLIWAGALGAPEEARSWTK